MYYFFRFILVFFVSLGLSSFAYAKPLGEVVTDLFFDSEPKLEVPTDFLNDGLKDGKFTRPQVGYGFQFTNHPENKDLYLRKETLNLTLAIPVPDLPVQLGPSLKAEFIRPFRKPRLDGVFKDLVKTHPPYGPGRVPHNDENALQMEPGEYYTFTANMSLGISPSTAVLNGLGSISAPSIYARYVVAGDFKVEVYRLNGYRVKVIASSLRSKAKSIGFKTRFVPDLEVFGITFADNLLNNFLTADLVEWSAVEATKGNLFSVSYIYNLNTNAGVEAFNALMDPRQWRKPTLNINKNVGGKFNPVERSFWLADISQSRGYAENNVPGVTHVDHSELEFDQISNGIKLDILVADKNSRRHFAEIDYSYQPEAGGDVEHYRIANLEINKDYQVLVNLAEAEVRREATAVFDLNEDQQITGFRELHFLYRREDKKLVENFFQKEASSVVGQMRKMLPPELMGAYLKTLNEFLAFSYKQSKGNFVMMEMTVAPAALRYLQQLTREDINRVIDPFMNHVVPLITSKNKSKRMMYGSLELFPTIDRLKNSDSNPELYFSFGRMNQIKNGLYSVIQGNNTPEENEKHWDIFKDLRQNIILRDFGSAYILRLLAYATKKYGDGSETLQDVIYFKARVQSHKQPERSIVIGRYRRPDATLALLTKKDRVMNRSYNPIHFKE